MPTPAVDRKPTPSSDKSDLSDKSDHSAKYAKRRFKVSPKTKNARGHGGLHICRNLSGATGGHSISRDKAAVECCDPIKTGLQ